MENTPSKNSISADKRLGDSSALGLDSKVKGQAVCKGDVRIDGVFEGAINCDSELLVGEQGQVIAEVSTKSLRLFGELRGNVFASERAELFSSARLLGDLRCPNIVVHDGAEIQGRCESTSLSAIELADRKAQNAAGLEAAKSAAGLDQTHSYSLERVAQSTGTNASQGIDYGFQDETESGERFPLQLKIE